MLAQYELQLQNLLQSPAAPANLYSQSNLDLWINTARGQVAGEAECVRVIMPVTTVVGQREYPFSAAFTFDPNNTGIRGVIHVRRIHYVVGGGQKRINGKSWEWFDTYRLSNPVPDSGPPNEWAQYAQGSSGGFPPDAPYTVGSGSFYIDPLPDLAYTLYCDCVCYPNALFNDNNFEVIPYLWTDAVPYFAAYLALMSAQTGQRIQEALQMKQLYSEFMQRARNYATPAVNRYLYEQVPDPASQAAMQAGPSAAPGAGG